MPARRRANNVHSHSILRIHDSDWCHIVRSFGLSPQQSEVLRHVMSGACDKQIALAMDIRVSTVRTYLSRLFARVGCTDRVELILHAVACIYSPHAAGNGRAVMDAAPGDRR